MSFIKFIENKENLVSGPGIDLLKSTFLNMFERGAPVEDDFTGFNKIHYASFLRISKQAEFSQKAIPVRLANEILDILAVYRNTQITNYEDIKKAVTEDIKKSLNVSDQNQNEIVVYNNQARVYGKIKVYIPGSIDRQLASKIKKLIVQIKQLQKVRNKFGTFDYETFKYFNKDKDQFDVYYIHQDVIDDVVKLISDNKKLTVKKIGTIESSADKSGEPIKKDIKELTVLGLQDTRFGKKIAIQLSVSFEKSKAILDAANSANLVPRGYSFDGSTRPPKFLISAEDKDLFISVRQKIIDGGVNVDDLDEFVKSNEIFKDEQQKQISFEKPSTLEKPRLSFRDPSDGKDNTTYVSIPYAKVTPEQKSFLKELIQYTFPNYRWHSDSYSYVITGDFKQYVSLGQNLKRFGYNVDDLRTILDKKIKTGGVKSSDYEGKISKDFKEKIEERLPESKFELYDEQKDGIAFLYSRNYAILGDATGVGKCVTLDSLLLTDKGMIRIGDLAPKNKKMAEDTFYPIDQDIKVWTGKRWSKIKSFYYSGIKPAIKASTRLGYEVVGSMIHPLMTRNSSESFSQLKDITKDDYMLLVRDSNIEFPTQEPDLPEPEKEKFGLTARVYTTPKKLSPDLAAFLGYVVSEAWTASKYRINIFQDKHLNPETHDHIRCLAKNLFGWDGNKNKDLKDFEIHITSVYLRSYLKNLGIDFCLSSQKSVPWPIFKGTKESVISFLRSFFDSEGSVCEGSIEASSASEKMLKEIQILLLRLGIVCSRKPKIVKNRNHVYWRITISGSEARKFKETIGFISKRKNQYLECLVDKKINPNIDVIPYCKDQIENLKTEILKATSKTGSNSNRKNSGIKQFGRSFQSTVSNIVNRGRNPTYQFLKKIIEISKNLELQETNSFKLIEKIYQNYFFYDPIANLEEVEEELADIEVEDEDHCFVANGFINHNTVQMVSAAEIKMQDLGDSSKTLIITLKAVQNQWKEEIQNVVGKDARISTDGTNPAKWTVLYYDNFSSGKNLQNVINTTMNAGYSIVIFDELHKLKHEGAKRSQNIFESTKRIPYKWGASATISSNRPFDVKNQLTMIGHPLGEIPEGKFKKEFAGMVPEGYRGSYVDGSFEDRIRAAEKLNKWLNLSGVYVRRTKEELRKMPDLNIEAHEQNIDESEFYRKLRDKIKDYSNPDLRISELIASRAVLAELKVDSTVNKAFEIIKSNLDKPDNNHAASKVVIFTNFVEPGAHIYERLSSKLQQLDPNFKVLTYLSLTKKEERNKVKEIFSKDPNVKALVMSMKMGGTGISFPNASQNMIINDFDWTPESAEQSEGRIYRINTDHPVNITYTVAEGLDKDLFIIVQRKRKIAELIQKYRKEYQNSEVDEESIKKIIDAQKKMQEIDEEINALIRKAVAKASNENVSFKKYLNLI